MKLRSVVNVVLLISLVRFFPSRVLDVKLDGVNLAQEALRAHAGFPVAELRGPKKTDPHRLGVDTYSPSVVVRDVETGVELFSQDAELERPIASITKLMTAMVLLDEYEWDWADTATVLREDVREGGRWYVRFGNSVTMEQLFSTMLIASGNNETLALLREVGAKESDFVDKMNAKARELGLTKTHFADPIGLDPRNVSTARDVMDLLTLAIEREGIAQYIGKDSVHFASLEGYTYDLDSTNHLFDSFVNEGEYHLVGGKTGSLDEAGFCMTVRVEKNGIPLDITVLGSPFVEGRFADVKALAYWTFDVYNWEQ